MRLGKMTKKQLLKTVYSRHKTVTICRFVEIACLMYENVCSICNEGAGAKEQVVQKNIDTWEQNRMKERRTEHQIIMSNKSSRGGGKRSCPKEPVSTARKRSRKYTMISENWGAGVDQDYNLKIEV